MSERKRARPAPLPPALEELAVTAAATIAAAAFLAPKGVSCTLPRLAAVARSLCGREICAATLRRLCGLDVQYALRYATSGAAADPELELVLREPLRVAAGAGAVKARVKRLRALLAAHAAALGDAEVPQVPLPSPGSPRSGPGQPLGASASALSGLPSPPPKPLRRQGNNNCA